VTLAKVVMTSSQVFLLRLRLLFIDILNDGFVIDFYFHFRLFLWQPGLLNDYLGFFDWWKLTYVKVI
jgi:hypothetical protein